MNAITPKQRTRLVILYGQLAAHTLDGADRESRLKWASELAGRRIASFNDLTYEEARRMIDGLQGQLGIKAPPRSRPGRQQARRAGLDGRHDGQEFQDTPQMATARDLATIENYYHRLGWTREQFDAWLRSGRSPLTNRSNPSITTLAQANRVRWALKGMLKQRGFWEER